MMKNLSAKKTENHSKQEKSLQVSWERYAKIKHFADSPDTSYRNTPTKPSICRMKIRRIILQKPLSHFHPLKSNIPDQ